MGLMGLMLLLLVELLGPVVHVLRLALARVVVPDAML
jgi:hypothetical protein